MTTTFVDKLVCRFCGSATGIFLGHSSSIWLCRDQPACWQRERRQAEERERYEALGRVAEARIAELEGLLRTLVGAVVREYWRMEDGQEINIVEFRGEYPGWPDRIRAALTPESGR